MTAIFKGLLYTAPALVVVLWIVLVKQERQNVEMEEHGVKFERKQETFNEDFDAFLNPKKETELHAKRKKERLEKIEEAKKEAEELKNRKATATRRDKETMDSFEAAFEDFEREKITQKGGD